MRAKCPLVTNSLPRVGRVEVYRNLNFRGGVVWSVRSRGKVVEHSERVLLSDVVFRVHESGRMRVLKELRNNVHAFVTGKVVGEVPGGDWEAASYDPRRCGEFLLDGGAAVKSCRFARLGPAGLEVLS